MMLSTGPGEAVAQLSYNGLHMSTYTQGRRIAATIIGTAMLAAPALAFAQDASSTPSGIEAQIKALLGQVAALQQQLRSLVGSTTLPWIGSHAKIGRAHV